MSQCDFVKNGYVLDAETLEIFNSYHCIKQIGHAGRHKFHKNPAIFYKTFGGAVTEQIVMIRKRKKMLKMISINERKRDLQIQKAVT